MRACNTFLLSSYTKRLLIIILQKNSKNHYDSLNLFKYYAILMIHLKKNSQQKFVIKKLIYP